MRDHVSIKDKIARVVGNIADDLRRTWETLWFGKAVTPRSHTITIGSLGEKTLAEQLGWVQPERESPHSFFNNHSHEPAAHDPSSPDRGIDL